MPIRVACLMLLAVVGCRGDVDQKIDALVADGISVQRNSAGDVFWIDTAGATLDEQFWLSLSEFERLEQLSLTGSEVSDADVSRLTSLKALQSLDLSYTNITSNGLHVLSRIRVLESLSLNGIPLDEAAVEPLSQLTRLRSLSLVDTGIAAEGVAIVQNALPGCLIVR